MNYENEKTEFRLLREEERKQIKMVVTALIGVGIIFAAIMIHYYFFLVN